MAIYFHGKTKVPSCYCYFFSVKMIRLSSRWCWDFCLFFNFIKSLLPQMLDTKLQMRKLFISIPSMLAAHRGLNCYKSVNALDQNSFQKCWFLALVILVINNDLHTIFLHFFSYILNYAVWLPNTYCRESREIEEERDSCSMHAVYSSTLVSFYDKKEPCFGWSKKAERPRRPFYIVLV